MRRRDPEARCYRSESNYLRDVKDEYGPATSEPSVWRQKPSAAFGRSRGAWVRRGSRSHRPSWSSAHFTLVLSPCHVVVRGIPWQLPLSPPGFCGPLVPVSKTDQRPLAAVARGGCTCRGRELEADCVYHACADPARLLHAHLGHTAGDPLLSA